MPIYEYICTECIEMFETISALKDAHKKRECPSCGKNSGERIISAASLGSAGGSFSSSGGGSCGPTGFS